MMSPGGTDEKVTIHGDADCLHPERSGERPGGQRSLP